MIKSIVLKNFMGYSEFKSDEFANVNVIIEKMIQEKQDC